MSARPRASGPAAILARSLSTDNHTSPEDDPVNDPLNRRTFLSASAAAGLAAASLGASPQRPVGTRRPVVISSANGLKTLEKAMELIKAGSDPLDAAVAGVAIVEADPTDH